MFLNALFQLAVAVGALMGFLALLRLNALQEQIDALTHEIAALRREKPGPPPQSAAAPQRQAPAPLSPEASAREIKSPETTPLAPQTAPAPDPKNEPPVETAAAQIAAGPDRIQLFMQSLSKNWLIWLGGLALVLGGAFLLKSAVDAGFFGPPMRIAAALAIGAFVIVAGDRLAKEREATLGDRATPDAWRKSAAPGALAGAGGATIYGAIYAAYGLYEMLPAIIAAALLAAASAGIAAIAMRHRAQGLGVLAFAGAHGGPLLTASGAVLAGPLFLYVFGVTAGGFFVADRMNWRRVAYAAMGGGLAWPFLWSLAAPASDISVYIFLPAFAAFVVYLARRDADRPFTFKNPPGADAQGSPTLSHLTAPALCGTAFVALTLTFGQPDAVEGAVMWTALYGLSVAATRWRRYFSFAPFLIAASIIAATAIDGAVVGDWRWSLFFAALFYAGGGAAMRRAADKALIACAAGLGPTALLAVQYWIGADAPSFALFAGVFVAIAANIVMIADLVKREGGADASPGAISAFVIGASGAGALAATMAFSGMTLSGALAAQAPVLALLWRRFDLPALKYCSAALAVVSSIRLLLLPEVFSYAVGDIPIFNLLLVGYLAPAAAFWFAARTFERGGLGDKARIVQALEGGAIALFSVFVTLEIRHFLNGGDIGAGAFSLTEASLQTLNWLSIAAFMRWRFGEALSAVRRFAEIGLLGAAGAVTFFYSLIYANPAFGYDPQPIGGLPVLNSLLLYYLAPALGFAAAAFASRRSGLKIQSRMLGAASAVVGASWLTLAIRHVFQAPYLAQGEIGLHEGAALASAWALAAAAAGYRFMRPDRFVVIWSFRILLMLAAAMIGLIGVIGANPWWGVDPQPIGGPPFINLLAFDYLAPAFGFVAAAWAAGRAGHARIAKAGAYFAALLGLLWLILVVRHLFHAPQLNAGFIGLGESWSYSAAIIIYAAGLLVVGALRRLRLVSVAGFAALMLAAFKVFIFDMGGLEGVWRASAFLGLGATLIGIAVLYQRTAAGKAGRDGLLNSRPS